MVVICSIGPEMKSIIKTGQRVENHPVPASSSEAVPVVTICCTLLDCYPCICCSFSLPQNHKLSSLGTWVRAWQRESAQDLLRQNAKCYPHMPASAPLPLQCFSSALPSSSHFFLPLLPFPIEGVGMLALEATRWTEIHQSAANCFDWMQSAAHFLPAFTTCLAAGLVEGDVEVQSFEKPYLLIFCIGGCCWRHKSRPSWIFCSIGNPIDPSGAYHQGAEKEEGESDWKVLQ